MKKSWGFTLIEILLVLVIMGIIVAMAVPNFIKEYSDIQLNGTANDIMSMGRFAQAMAISRDQTYALYFSPDRRSYDLQQKIVNEDTQEQNGFVAVHSPLGRMHAVPNNIELECNKDRVGFHPDGTIDPATIELISPKRKIALSTGLVQGMIQANNE